MQSLQTKPWVDLNAALEGCGTLQPVCCEGGEVCLPGGSSTYAEGVESVGGTEILVLGRGTETELVSLVQMQKKVVPHGCETPTTEDSGSVVVL